MHRKRYPIITALFNDEVANQVDFYEKWRVFHHLGENSYLMVRHISGTVKIAPLFVYSFPLLAPHHLLESEKFNIRFSDPTQITEIADKLRWHRYKKALLQREVASLVGIDRSTYLHFEEIGRDYYPINIMEKIAAVFGVQVTELLDDYNLFLYNDQGKQIRERRQKLNVSQSEYARMLGVSAGNLRKWEKNQVRIIKSTWEKLFK